MTWSFGSPSLALIQACVFFFFSNYLGLLIRGHHAVPFVAPGLAQNLTGNTRESRRRHHHCHLHRTFSSPFQQVFLCTVTHTPVPAPPPRPSGIMTHSDFWQSQKNPVFKPDPSRSRSTIVLEAAPLRLAHAFSCSQGELHASVGVSLSANCSLLAHPERTVSQGGTPGSEVMS